MKNIKTSIFFIFKRDMQTLIYYNYKHYKHFTNIYKNEIQFCKDYPK